MKPIKLEPAFKDYLWGGNKLKDLYNKNTPFEITAESWELSSHKDGQSKAKGGDFDGLTLSEIIEKCKKENKNLLGKNCDAFSDFPVLIKLIDANSSLSIQVHPDDNYAKINENGSFGKTEVWYIMDAEEDAKLVYGFNRNITKDEFACAIENGNLSELLNFVPVKKGDVFFVEAGMVHAIGSGILICEIQQNSNTTYRVFDWNRVGADGKKRELHIEKALDVSNLSKIDKSDFSPEKIDDNSFLVADSKYFKVKKYICHNSLALKDDDSSFACINFTEGQGFIESKDYKEEFKKGDTFFIPADCVNISVSGSCEFLYTTV